MTEWSLDDSTRRNCKLSMRVGCPCFGRGQVQIVSSLTPVLFQTLVYVRAGRWPNHAPVVRIRWGIVRIRERGRPNQWPNCPNQWPHCPNQQPDGPNKRPNCPIQWPDCPNQLAALSAALRARPRSGLAGKTLVRAMTIRMLRVI